MTRILLAFAWLRWRLTANSFRLRGGRDLISHASRIGEVVGPWALALLVLPGALALAALGAFGGWHAARSADHREGVLLTARLVLGASTVMVLIGQLVRAMVGTRSDPTRFTLLPIPRRLLHASTVVSGLADPWLCVVFPGVFLFSAGLAVAGAVTAGALTFLATLLMLTILLLVGSCIECALQMLFRNRRRGEWVTLVATAALALAGFLPMFIDDRFAGSAHPDPAPTHLPRAVRFFPSELWGATAGRALDDRAVAALAALAGLAGTAAALYFVSAFLYGRLLDSPSVGSRRSRRSDGPRELPKLPGLSVPASTVAWAQFRSTLRTVSGKSLLLVGPLAFGLMVLVAPRVFRDESLSRFTVDPQTLVAFGAMAFSLISLPRISANQFALDGPGLTLQFLAPISDQDLVRGKAAGIGILWMLSVAAYLVIGLPQAPRGTPWTVPAALLSGAAAYFLFAPIAAILAAMFPKAADPSKLGSGAQPHPIATLVATMLAMGLVAIPAIVSLDDLPHGPTAAGFGGAALCALLAAGLSLPLHRLAADVLGRRREAIVFAARDR